MLKTLSFQSGRPGLYFWRTSNGAEVDLVIEDGHRLIPVEAKLSATPRAGMVSGIQAFRREYGDTSTPGWVIHTGDLALPLGNGTVALPFAML